MRVVVMTEMLTINMTASTQMVMKMVIVML